MSWIGITALVGILVVLAGLIAAYVRGYREGYREGEESGRLLESLEAESPAEERK